jgi:ABC-type nitrate/sulfonate/bicarbonate transport system permease component
MKPRVASIAPLLGLLALVAAWTVAAALLRSDALPGPSQVLLAGWRLLADGTLVQHTIVSLRRVLIGFVIGVAAGVILGLFAGLSWFASRTLHVLVELIRPVPGIAWLPLAILWFGLGEASKFFVIAIGVFFPVFVGAARGIRQADPLHVRSARAMGASRWQIIRDVLLPSALPEILTGQRVGLSLGFIYLIAAELIGARSGIGYMISYARIAGHPEHIYVGILLIGLLSLGLGAVQKGIERHMLRWHFGLERGGIAMARPTKLKHGLRAL